MARVLRHLVEQPRPCSYLPDRRASLEHRILVGGTPEELESMLARGWRRFGPDHFRPRCGACSECVPIRIPVGAFQPSKSQRRAYHACAGLRVEVAEPRVDRERLDLYARWHRFREAARDWVPSDLDEQSYFQTFAFPHPSAREIAYYDDDRARGPRLVGVGICDEAPSAWSAVYFYYDPGWADRSPGVFNVVRQVELARSRKIPHVYLGYWVARCPSMGYKARFRPHELLVGWPAAGEQPRWQRVDVAPPPP